VHYESANNECVTERFINLLIYSPLVLYLMRLIEWIVDL
jgi:hypothetical protein